MKKQTKITLLSIGVVVILLGVWVGVGFHVTLRDFLMEDVITYSYDSVIEKIYDYKEKNKDLPNSIDEYLKEARPLGSNNAKIEGVEYRKKDATFELSIKCEYYGKKYEYLYQDPKNLSDNQRTRLRTKAHGWVILRQK